MKTLKACIDEHFEIDEVVLDLKRGQFRDACISIKENHLYRFELAIKNSLPEACINLVTMEGQYMVLRINLYDSAYVHINYWRDYEKSETY